MKKLLLSLLLCSVFALHNNIYFNNYIPTGLGSSFSETAVVAPVVPSIQTTYPEIFAKLTNGWDDGTGVDKIGSNNLTLYGCTAGTGKVGESINFDGNDYATSTKTLNLANFSVSYWVNITRTSATQEVIMATTIGWVDASTFLVWQANSDYITYINISGSNSQLNYKPLSLGWHFMTTSSNGSTLKFFVDGIEVESITRAGSGTTNALYFGRRQAGYNDLYFLGDLNEIMIGTTLTLEEHQSMYNSGAGLKLK